MIIINNYYAWIKNKDARMIILSTAPSGDGDTSQSGGLPPNLVVSCALVQSVSCLDAIIHQANQVNRRRNDQCVNAHGLADVAQTNWQR